jgi:ankyrin repeat protein/tetratricopeptide (TPR) repeat protein
LVDDTNDRSQKKRSRKQLPECIALDSIHTQVWLIEYCKKIVGISAGNFYETNARVSLSNVSAGRDINIKAILCEIESQAPLELKNLDLLLNILFDAYQNDPRICGVKQLVHQLVALATEYEKCQNSEYLNHAIYCYVISYEVSQKYLPDEQVLCRQSLTECCKRLALSLSQKRPKLEFPYSASNESDFDSFQHVHMSSFEQWETSLKDQVDARSSTPKESDGQKLLYHFTLLENHRVVKFLLSDSSFNHDLDINKKGNIGLHNETILCTACRYGYVEMVFVLLDYGADITIGQPQETCLHIACKEGHAAIVDRLIKHPHFRSIVNLQKQENYTGNTAFHIAAEEGHFDICEKLLGAGVKVTIRNTLGQSTLQILVASWKGKDIATQDKLACLLIEQRIKDFKDDINERLLENAVRYGLKQTVERHLSKLITINNINKLLSIACDRAKEPESKRTQSCRVVLLYLIEKASMEKFSLQVMYTKLTFFDGNVLHYAANKGWKDVVLHILKYFPEMAAQTDSYQKLPIHYAAEMNQDDTEIVEVLVQKAPDTINATDSSGDTPLHQSVASGNVAITKWLCLCGAKEVINLKNTIGETPLILLANKDIDVLQEASASKYVEICAFLILKDADLKITNKDGKTALQIQREKRGGKAEVIQLLNKMSSVANLSSLIQMNNVNAGGNISATIFINKLVLEPKNKEAIQNIPWELPLPSKHFIGRTHYLTEITQRLEQSTTASPVVLYGMGGVGKTYLALQVVHNSSYIYSFEHWFRAEDIKDLNAQYVRVADKLGCVYKTFEDIKLWLKKWLESNPGWLLVYDNASDLKTLKDYLPQKGGHILITSRSPEWDSNGNLIHIDVMERVEAVALVKKISNRNDAEIEQLAVEILGRLPLALAQASAYIEKCKTTVAKYVDIYREKKKKLLADNKLPPGDDHISVYVTWDVSIDKIKQMPERDISENTLNILAFCAYVDADNIPRQLLEQYLHDKGIEDSELALLNEVIAILESYSMIKATFSSVSIHRLVQDVIREQISYEKQDCDVMRIGLVSFNILFQYNKYFTMDRSTWRKVKGRDEQLDKLMPHIIRIIEYYVANIKATLVEDRTVRFCESEESIRQQEVDNLSIAISKSLLETGADDLSAAQAGQNVAISHLRQSTGSVGKISSKVSESDSPVVEKAICLSLKAVQYSIDVNMDYKLAEQMLSYVENIRQKYSIQELLIAKFFRERGNLHFHQGKYKEALNEYEEALKILGQHKIKLLPRELEKANILNQKGNTLFRLSQLENAMGCFGEALEVYNSFEQNEHPNVAIFLTNRGNVFLKQNSYVAAQKDYECALEVFKKAVLIDHPEAANTYHQLGHVLYLQKKYDQSECKYRKALKIYREFYGKGRHKDEITSLCTISCMFFYYKNEKIRALKKSKKALEICSKIYGFDKRGVQEMCDRFESQEKYEEAMEGYKGAISTYVPGLGAGWY